MQRVAVMRLRARSLLKHATGVIMFSALTGCLSPLRSPLEMAGVGPGDSVDSIRNTDLVARYPTETGGQALLNGAPLRPQVFPGSDARSGASGRSAGETETADLQPPTPSGGGGEDGSSVEINFDNGDIQTVAKSILSDTLGYNVVVDPRIQGNVTIASSTPIARKDLLGAFESVMRMSNAAVVHEGSLMKIVPLSDAGGTGKVTLQSGQAGFGVTVVPLHYTSAATIAKMAENFLAKPGALRADTTRNLLMVQGTLAERQNAVDLITSFDVEWLRNQSVGIYPLKSTSPDTMIHELERVFETADGGQGQGLVSFQPIARMNAVMAVTHNRKLLDQATQWVKRLDHSDTSGTTIRIYRLEHGNAPKIAKILGDIFVGRSGGATADTAANQVAPGANSAQSRLDSIGPGNSQGDGGISSSNNSVNSQQSSQSGGAITNGTSTRTVSSFDGFAGGPDKKDADGERDMGSLPRGVFQNVRITADTGNNSIIVYSNLEDYQVIERSLRELDRPQLQVAIDATIAEVTLTDALQYGVQYYFGSSDVGAGTNNGSISLSASTSTAVISQVLPGLNVLLGQQASPKIVLSALSSLTSVKVLSAPSLVVTNNQPAYLQVGDSVPISTGSATVLSSSNTIVNTITMQDTGVILKVWPHVHGNGVVDL